MSTKVRIIYKNRWRDGDVLAYSSQHPQHPVEDSQEDTLTMFWRTRYGTDSGCGLFVVTASNNYIRFDEGGAELTAIFTLGNYNAQTLATEIKTQLDANGALTYTVTYSESTGKFTIAATGNFTLRWNTGTGAAGDASDLLGFSDAADDTGAATYTGDYVRIHYPMAYASRDLGTAYEYDFAAILNHNISSSATIKLQGADDDAFTTNLVEDEITWNANNIYFFLSAARTKRYIRLKVEDPTNPAGYIQIGNVFVGKYFEPSHSFGKGHGQGKEDLSEIEESDSLVLFSQEKPITEVRTLPFNNIDDTSRSEFLLLQEECGIHKSFIICFDYSDPNNNSLLARLEDTGMIEYQHVNCHSYEMSIREFL